MASNSNNGYQITPLTIIVGGALWGLLVLMMSFVIKETIANGRQLERIPWMEERISSLERYRDLDRSR